MGKTTITNHQIWAVFGHIFTIIKPHTINIFNIWAIFVIFEYIWYGQHLTMSSWGTWTRLTRWTRSSPAWRRLLPKMPRICKRWLISLNLIFACKIQNNYVSINLNQPQLKPQKSNKCLNQGSELGGRYNDGAFQSWSGGCLMSHLLVNKESLDALRQFIPFQNGC